MDYSSLDEFCPVQDVHIASSFESNLSLDDEMSGSFDFGYFGMAADKDLNESEHSYFLCPEIQPTYYQEESGLNPSPLLPESQSYTELIPVQGNYESYSLYDYEEKLHLREPNNSPLPSFGETYNTSSVLGSQVSYSENNLAVTSIYDLSNLQTLNLSDIAEQNDPSLEEASVNHSNDQTLESYIICGSHTSSSDNILGNSFATSSPYASSPPYVSSPSWIEQYEESYEDDKFVQIEHATQPLSIENSVDDGDKMCQENGTSDWLREIRETKNARPRGPKCWEFLLRLLMDHRSNPSLIRWEDQSQGIFRLANKDKISTIWGSRPCKKKKEEGIKYDSFARNLRYHYKSGKGKVRSVSEKHLVYKFPDEVMELITNKRIR